MTDFDCELTRRLDAIREEGLYRELRRVDSAQGPRIEIGGRRFINFSSNDYLGLANHPALKEAAIKAVERFGAGSGASRLICGSLAPHHELEEALAQFKGTEATLSFSTGYATALGTICALLGKDDVIVLDNLVHACIVDAARLCGAKLRVFAHNDLDDLEKILKWADKKRAAGVSPADPSDKMPEARLSRTLIVTESVFSMDGDQAPLRELVELKEKYGAWLMVDEAHATGLFGTNRRGLAEELGVSNRIEIQMGTLGKALGASGGYICGSRALIDFLVNRARSFIFSTAPVPAAAAAATAGIRLIQSEAGEDRRRTLWQRVKLVGADVRRLWNPLRNPENDQRLLRSAPTNTESASAIIPLPVGDETKAAELATSLRERGIFIPAIRYPTVARGTARLRVTLTAAHSADEVATLAQSLEQIVNRKS